MELLVLLAVGWLASPVVLGIALVASRRRRRAADAAVARAVPAPSRPAVGIGELVPRDVASLLLLQVELEQQRAAGELAADRHESLRASLERVWAHALAHDGHVPGTGKWRRRRDEAWGVLVRRLDEPPGRPPWMTGAEEPPAAPPAVAPRQPAQPRDAGKTVLPLGPGASEAVATREPGVDSASAAGVEHPEPVAADDEWSLDAAPSAIDAQPQPRPVPAARRPVAGRAPSAASTRVAESTRTREPEDTATFAFAPAPPSALGRAIETLSGWPRLVAPFLVQNIGWFVGGFCFVAGTLFLVSVTSGYANALVILASLAVYTGFLAWAGYAIRRKSPELRTSSNVLLAISMLLAPLNITAGVHLVSAGIGSLPALALALALAAAQCVGLLIAARLVNALMDRALPMRHAQLFAALSGLQLAAPLVTASGGWLALAAAHAAVLALVGWGLIAFAREWVRSIFLDRRLIAYYSAGLLVFAALVSFVQIAYAYPAPLPRGYLGPYVMALCAMLFYVDAALKEWTKKHAFLSRFTFGLYALTVVALALCFDAPVPRTVALVLAAATYAQVLWRYSSVAALYLLLAALGWLYGTLVLGPLPRELHLLASLPGLAGLFALLRWTESRSVALATICLRTFGAAFVGLTAWSLYHGAPGLVAFATGAAATAAVFYALVSAPWLLRTAVAAPSAEVVFYPGPWYYVVAGLAAVTVVYAPAAPGLARPDQLAFSLLGLATVAAWVGLRMRTGASEVRTEASLNSTIVLLVASVAIGAQAAAGRFPEVPALAALLVLAACLAAWTSVELRARWLFYAVLAALGVSALIVKRTYFPSPSFGTGELVGTLALWACLWWLEGLRAPAGTPSPAPGETAEPGSATMRLLWSIPVARAGVLGSEATVR